jgi:hypothetical protein
MDLCFSLDQFSPGFAIKKEKKKKEKKKERKKGMYWYIKNTSLNPQEKCSPGQSR